MSNVIISCFCMQQLCNLYAYYSIYRVGVCSFTLHLDDKANYEIAKLDTLLRQRDIHENCPHTTLNIILCGAVLFCFFGKYMLCIFRRPSLIVLY